MILIDAHTHLHDGVDLGLALDAAHANFSAVAQNRYGNRIKDFCLMLTESSPEDAFGRLAALAQHPSEAALGGWHITATEENESLVARRRENTPPLTILSGIQVATRERLEVLGLAMRARVPDGLSLRASIDAVCRAGGLPVLPWGFGKWWGARGRQVANAIANSRPGDLFLGDNGGRWAWLPEPVLLAQGRGHDFKVLPGSDSLPLADEFRRIGGFGFAIEGVLSIAHPAQDLKNRLRAPRTTLESFGKSVGLLAFVRNQLLIQFHRRRESVRKP